MAFAADSSGANTLPTNPAFSYLKVTSYGRASYLVLGYTDAAQASEPVQVWYSAKGEVLKTQAGRVVGTVGLETDWREVTLRGNPSWADVISGASKTWQYQRRRDVMPGYQANVSEVLQLLEVTPQHVLPKLGGPAKDLANPPSLRWFQETQTGGRSNLPSAWYALNSKGVVVLTHQCLSPKLCLTLEPWAPAAASPRAAPLNTATP